MNGQWDKMRKWGVAFLLLFLPLAFLHPQETAVSEHFRLDGGFSATAGRSASAAFRLSACMCAGIAGVAASESYVVLAGCAALLPGNSVPRPHPDPEPRFPEEHSEPSPAGGGNVPGSEADAGK